MLCIPRGGQHVLYRLWNIVCMRRGTLLPRRVSEGHFVQQGRATHRIGQAFGARQPRNRP